MFLSSPHSNLNVLEVLIIAHPAIFVLEIFGSGDVCVTSTLLHGAARDVMYMSSVKLRLNASRCFISNSTSQFAHRTFLTVLHLTPLYQLN
jgi:hypothetical protein